MLTLVFATNNNFKVTEVRNLIEAHLNRKGLSAAIEIIGLADAGCHEELPETSDTLEDNASQKAFFVYRNFSKNCFADDTGLEIEALNGRPGVLSARYAGEDKNFENNIRKVLQELHDIPDRRARFRTVISLVIDEKETRFEGIVNGRIITSPRGSMGFGYDPVFLPDGYDKTFAEMTLEEKNKISHRAMAIRKMIEYLNENIVGSRQSAVSSL
ncbi:MAG: RdgB/HAM1 family non-canonical purine NTP pyrophosphatase [Bacteroidetes bacterium]|nr:RdgB/HAM1 family non-canonical purine NTP pyrophosphatase [Bacteroidota bacterium]